MHLVPQLPELRPSCTPAEEETGCEGSSKACWIGDVVPRMFGQGGEHHRRIIRSLRQHHPTDADCVVEKCVGSICIDRSGILARCCSRHGVSPMDDLEALSQETVRIPRGHVDPDVPMGTRDRHRPERPVALDDTEAKVNTSVGGERLVEPTDPEGTGAAHECCVDREVCAAAQCVGRLEDPGRLPTLDRAVRQMRLPSPLDDVDRGIESRVGRGSVEVLEVPWTDPVVSVQEENPFGGHLLEPEIPSGARSGPGGGDDAHPPVLSDRRTRRRGSSFGGTVVNHDRLPRGQRLGLQASEGSVQSGSRVRDQDDDRDERHPRSGRPRPEMQASRHPDAEYRGRC